MDALKCNRLSCRTALLETAVVTTCSHCFCVNCANELFSAAGVCPACEASLTEPDDVVICSLQPSNDYKTSVLSGLSPALILEVCGRAMSFWNYQNHQESCFQQAVLKSVNDRAAQLQKHAENVIREANSELNLLGSKITGLERDLELERRKTKDLQEQLREKDKDYTKLKNQYDKIKRKALLAPGAMGDTTDHQAAVQEDSNTARTRAGTTAGLTGFGISMDQVVGGMEANRLQRTPLRAVGNSFASNVSNWQQGFNPNSRGQPKLNRFQAVNNNGNNGNINDNIPRQTNRRSGSDANETDSGNEVEAMLGIHENGPSTNRMQGNGMGQNIGMSGRQGLGNLGRQGMQSRMSGGQPNVSNNAARGSNTLRKSGTFRPAGFAR